MSKISILTTYSEREVSPNIVVLLLSWLIVISAPLGVLVLVALSGMVVGSFPPGPGLSLFWFFPLCLWVRLVIFNCSNV
jgi:hypothetical protein